MYKDKKMRKQGKSSGLIAATGVVILLILD